MDLQNRRVKRKTWSTTDNPAAAYDRYCECQADEDKDEDEDEEARAAEREFRNYDPFGGP